MPYHTGHGKKKKGKKAKKPKKSRMKTSRR